MPEMMATYKCKLTFDVLYFSGDFSDAASPITYRVDDEDVATPFQTADARHDPAAAAELLVGWFGRGYWHSPDAIDEDGDDTDEPGDYIVSVEPVENYSHVD